MSRPTSLRQMYRLIRVLNPDNSVPEPDSDFILWAIDPGETTGVACFYGLELKLYGQIKATTPPEAGTRLRNHLLDNAHHTQRPSVVVSESYRPFAHKIQQHIGNPLFTPQVIGALKLITSMANIPHVEQAPHQAKGFMKDERLKEWSLWLPGKQHARDAIRHACYYYLFDTDHIWT